jgi:DNA modification methylase
MNAIRISIKDIKSNPNNPRIIKDDKFKKLVQSIIDFPRMLEIRPIVVNDEMVVLGGNMRLKACKEAGLKEIPVIKASDLTPEQQREFIIKDNVGFGEWDWAMLANEWDSDELQDWGLDIPDFETKEIPEVEDDNYEIPNEIQTDIVIGDLFEIGEHRLLCGDSTSVTDVEKLMNKKKAELLFTSPPYSDMRTYEGNKDLSIDNLIDFIPTYFSYTNYQIINLGIQRKNHEIVQYWDNYIKKAKECGYKFLSWNVWNKLSAGNIGNQIAFMPIEHEWIFVFGVGFKNNNRTEEKKINRNKSITQKRNKNGDKDFTSAGHISTYKELGSIIEIAPETSSGITSNHPARFPIELPYRYLMCMTNENDYVVEPFCGSGTTMVASHQLKRKCYAMELEPKYCQIIIDRMRKLDPDLKVKRNGIEI